MSAERDRRLGRAMIGHLPALRRYALGLSGSAAAADDLVQDCIERALRRLGALQDEARMAGWLRTTLFNLFVDGRRSWRNRGEVWDEEVWDRMEDGGAAPETRHELTQTVRAMGALAPQHRQVLLLVGVEGLSYREVADELGVPIGTVMSRLARARDALRAELAAPVRDVAESVR